MKDSELYCRMCGKKRPHKYVGMGGSYYVWCCKHCGAKTSTAKEDVVVKFEGPPMAGGKAK